MFGAPCGHLKIGVAYQRSLPFPRRVGAYWMVLSLSALGYPRRLNEWFDNEFRGLPRPVRAAGGGVPVESWGFRGLCTAAEI